MENHFIHDRVEAVRRGPARPPGILGARVAGPNQADKGTKNAIAIVGMACRYPDARSPAELWENVLAGRRAFRRIPAERLRLEDYYSADADVPDRIYSTQAAVLEDYKFDRMRFRVAGSSFRSADLTHWLALEVASDALADAGFPEASGLPRETAGVLVGNSLTGEFTRANLMRLRWPYVRRVVGSALLDEGWDDARSTGFLERLEEVYKTPFPPITEESLAGGLSNTIAGRISNHFDLHGGGFTVDGACSSSLLAVSQAASALVAGDLDVALAGGVDLSLDPFELVGFAKTGALAAEEMRVYDARSAGFWPGEGCGMVVLARLEDALAEGRRVYAVLRGWGISSDGQGGLTRPTEDGHLLALRRAYARAGFGVETVGYFEGHGTGTAVGDATELRALSRARREAGAREPAALSSIKANIGHTKAAAGVAGLIKAVLAVQRRVLPSHVGATEPHPELAGDAPALRLLPRARPWPEGRPLRAAVSAMGFGGINTHIVVEGLATPARTELDSFETSLVYSAQDAELFLLAAAGVDELVTRLDELVALAGGLTWAQLGDLAAELARRLVPGRLRAAVLAGRPDELGRRLATLAERLRDGALDGDGRHVDLEEGLFAGLAGGTPRIGFLFPGQGAPSHLDGGILRRRFLPVEQLYERAALPAAGDDVETAVAQPAIITASIAGLRVLETLGVTGSVAVGHSLGELTALHWAGALGCEDLLDLAAARGRAMGELGDPTGTMAAIEAGAGEVEALLGDGAVISGLNSPRQTIVSGSAAALDEAMSRAAGRGLAVHRLKVSHAFHSPLVAAAVPRLCDHLDTADLRPVRARVASTITGRLFGPDDDLADLLVRQITEPVRFTEAMAAAGNVDLWIEIGPGRVLTRLAGEIAAAPAIATDAGGPSLRGVLQAVAAGYVLGAPIHARMLFAGRFTRPLDLVNRPGFFASPCEWVPDAARQMAPAPPAVADSRAAVPVAEPTTEPVVEAPPAPAATEPIDMVRELVARRVELPVGAIGDGNRLLSDLHLNSISVGQVVTEVARHLGLEPPVAPTEFADATVVEIAEALGNLSAASAADTDESAPAGVDAWVRPFTVELVERPLPPPPAATPAGAAGWRIVAPPGHPLAGALEAVLAEVGHGHRGVVLCLPPDVGEAHLALFLEAARTVTEKGMQRFVLVQQGGGGGGFARTVHLEMPAVTSCVCDVPLDDPRAAEWVAAEALAARGYSEAHYDRTGVRREPVLRPLPPSDEGPVTLGPGDVLLVTGGGKGIAAECALALARQTGVKLALLGRSTPAADGELASNLERLTASGVSWRYFSADVTDSEAVAAAIHSTAEEWGPVTALLHGAGVNTPQLLSALDEASFKRTLRIKVRGLDNVLWAIDPDALRLVVAFGSIIARTGMRGEADYALANEWLARRVEDFQAEHPDCRCLTFEWSVWSGVGMGERLGRIEALVKGGITPITPDAGIGLFRELLERPPRATSVVITGRYGDAPTLRPEQPELPLQRFLERPRVFYPGVELVVDTRITAATDPYLDDHVYRGERLFPAVMGLEAISQTAMAVVGTARLPVFEALRFERPVAVPDGEGVTLRLAALVDSADRVEVVLRSSATGFAVDHFRAVCCFGEPEEATSSRLLSEWGAAGERLAIVPEADLYGGILFHEGRFRRLDGYRRLRATECMAEIASDGVVSWFGSYLPSDTLLGDPGARDTALHGIQACIPHATILPVGVERLVSGCIGSTEPWIMAARERRRDGRDFFYDLEIADAEGNLCERWEGLHLRAVDTLEAPPAWVTPLLAPYIERRLEELVPSAAVAVALEHRPGDDRRAAGDRAVERLLGPGASVRRRPDGKPELCGGRDVSLAHAGEIVLAVVGGGRLGCDIEPVNERPSDLWRDLLGEERFRFAATVAGQVGEAPDTTATRMWTILESLKKIGAPHDTPLTLGSSTADGWQLYSAGRKTVGSLVVPIREIGGETALAVLFGGE